MGRTDGPGRRLAAALAIACAGCVAGCGNSRTIVPSLSRPAAVGGFRTLSFSAAGITVDAPAGWTVAPQRAPLVAIVGSGDAVIVLWRYPRAAPSPSSAAELAAARASLFRAVHARQGSVRVLASRLARIDGRPAIEFDALESVAGRSRRVLSTHVFTDRAEVVLEEYAPPARFTRLRHPVFARVRHSLALTGAGA